MPSQEVVRDPRRPKPAPIEYAGQWVAWNKAQTEIVAHGAVMADVHQAAVAAGHPDAILQKVRSRGPYLGAGLFFARKHS
jgi:hypothetical protein